MSSINDIQGRNCVFQMKIDDIYMDVLCAKTFSFNRVYELKETTTVQSGFDKEFRPRRKSYTISFNGVVQVVADANKPTIKTLFDFGEGFLPVFYRIIYEDNSGNVLVITGHVYLTSAIFNSNPINLLDGTIEMQGNGPIERSDVIPDLVDINIVSLGDNSIAATFQFKLFDVNGAVVFDSGMLPGASGGNLTHPVNVTGQVQKGMYSLFWQGDAQSIGNAFQTDAPPTKSAIFNNTVTNESTYGVQDYDFTANRAVTFTLGVPVPPPSCVSPSIASGGTLPDGQVSAAYSNSIVVNGSQPFNITNVTKPSWLTITITGGNTILLSGTPDVSGTGIIVSFDINNACGTVSLSDTIDIADAPVTTSYVSYNYDKNGLGMFRIYVNAILIVEVTDDAASSFAVNPGDVVEVQVLGGSIVAPLKKLTVINYTDSITLFDEDNTIDNKIFSWTIDAAKFYTIAASNHS